jgi:shikimate kinase
LPKSGKTALGRYISDQKKLNFFDLDETIESIHKKSKREIFEQLGEEKFRQLELEVFADILKKGGDIISVGGGFKIKKKPDFLIFWLKAPIEVIKKRLDPEAPYLKGKKFADWLDERLHLYASQSDIEVQISGTNLRKDCDVLWAEILGEKLLR